MYLYADAGNTNSVAANVWGDENKYVNYLQGVNDKTVRNWLNYIVELVHLITIKISILLKSTFIWRVNDTLIPQ